MEISLIFVIDNRVIFPPNCLYIFCSLTVFSCPVFKPMNQTVFSISNRMTIYRIDSSLFHFLLQNFQEIRIIRLALSA